MVSDEEEVANKTGCDHDMEDAMIDVIGPPNLALPNPDGSADIEPSDVKEQIPGSRCAKCGFGVPKNTAPEDRAPKVVFECLLGRGQPCRIVGALHQAYKYIDAEPPEGIACYEVERLAHSAAMGEPVWKRVEDVAQLLTVIRALLEHRETTKLVPVLMVGGVGDAQEQEVPANHIPLRLQVIDVKGGQGIDNYALRYVHVPAEGHSG